MIEAASLGVAVYHKDHGAVRGLKDLQREVVETARTTKTQMGHMEESAKKSTDGMKKALAGLGIGLSLAAIGGAAIKMGKELLRAGSDAEEMLGKFNVVMGAQADAVTQQLDAFGAAVGRSKFDLMEMAAGVQDTFVPLGFARDEASKMSVTLTQLATDVASFNNASDPEVMNAFTSAIVGNHEAVRQYGIIITEATLNTELLAMGIEKGTRGASEQEKVQARLNLIMKGTSDAQGDAARTSGSWANEQRGLNAVISDTQKEIGLKLLPVLTPLLHNFTAFARETMPEVIRSVSDAIITLSALNDTVQRFDYQRLVTGLDETGRRATTFSEQIAGFLANLAAWGDVLFGTLSDGLRLTGQQIATIGDLITGRISWDDFKQKMAEIGVEFEHVAFAAGNTTKAINDNIGKFDEMVAGFENVRQSTVDATEAWGGYDAAMHTTAASDAAAEMTTNVADSLSQLWERALPENEEGWAAYLEQMSTAMTDSSTLIQEHSETQLELIEEYGALRAELALQEQETVAALEAAGLEDSAARMSEYFDTALAGLEEQYQTRIDIEAGAMGTLQDLQANSLGTLMQNLNAFTSEAAERYGSYAETIVSLEQERDNVLAFLEAQYQNERARLQVSGDNQSLSLLASAHKAKYGNVVAYYNQRIKTEQVGQKAVFNVAKAYYLQTLMMMRLQLVNQLKTVAGTMDAMVRAMVGSYSALTAAAYGFKLAQEGKDLAAISAGIADVQNMMAALEGSGVAAASQASVAFDDWKDTVDDLGGGLDGIGDKLGGIGDSVGGSGGVKEKIIDPIKEAADTAQRLAQMVDKAIAAFDVLAEYGGPSPGWVTGYRKLLEAVEVMVRMFADTTKRILDMGLLAEKKREQLGNAVDVIGGTLQVISAALRVSQAFEEVEDQTADVSAILDRIKAEIILMVQKVIDISTVFNALGKDKLRDAARASEYLVEIMKPWSEAVKAISALVNLPAVDAQQFIERTVETMTALALAMVEVGQQVDRTEMRQAAQAAEGIINALKPWEPAVKAISAIISVPSGNIGEQTQKLMNDMLTLVETLRFAQRQLDPDVLKDVGKSAGLIVDALKPWETAAKAVSAVVTAPVGNIGDQAESLMQNIFTLIQKLVFAQRQFDPAALEEVSKSAGLIVNALKPWEAAAKAVEAVLTAPVGNIGDQAESLMQNIFTLIQKLVFAQRQFDPAALEEVSRSAGLIVNALKPWEAAAKAVETISKATNVPIDQRSEGLVQQMVSLINKMISAADLIDPADLEALARRAGPIVEALKPWKAAADAINAISEATYARIGPRSTGLVQQMVHLMWKMIRWSEQINPVDLEALARKAGPIVEALKPWKAAADAINAISEATYARIGPRSTGLVQQMVHLMWKMIRWSEQINPADLEALARRAGPIVEALKPWEAAANAVNAIAGAAVGRIGPAAELLVKQMLGLVRKLAKIAGQIRPQDLAAAAASAALFVEALKPWEVAAKAVDAIGRTTGERIGPKAELLVHQMMGLARKLVKVAREMPTGQLQEAARVATLFSDSLKPWQDAMTVVEALSKHANTTRIGPKAELLVHQMMGLARKLAKVGRDIGLPDLEFAARVGRLFGDVLEPWNKAITLSNDLRMWRELPDLQERMTRFARIWVDIVADLSKAVGILSTQGMEAVAAFGRTLTDLMGGLQAAMTVVSDFDFEPPDPTMWGNFQRWVQDTFTSFYAWVNAYGIPEPGMPAVPSFDEKGLAAVSLFAQALRDLMGGLEAALGIARDFEFQEPDPTMWAHFQSWVQSVFVSFYEWVNATAPPEPPMPGVPLFGGDGLAAVGAFAGALNSLMQGLQAALAIARDFEFQTPDATQWDAFFTWVTGVFQAFYTDIITRYPSEDPATTFTPVSAWGSALGALMGGLQSALAIAKDFEFVEPDADQWDAFFEWTTTTFEDFRAEIVRRYPEETPDFAPVTAWGGALGALMGGLQSALAIAADFDFQTPDATQWDAFFDWTTTVFEEFRAEIVRRYPADDPDQFAPVAAWANAFGALMSGLQSAISLASEFDWQAPDPDDWDDFFDWTLEVLEAFRVAITTRYPEATAATWEPVVAWSGALGALMQALETAVTMADSFAFTPPGDLGWQNFFDWVFEVFDAFRLEILARFPENPEEAGQFPAVIALSNAIGAIFSGLQSALAFFMDLHGPGEAFWTFLAGAGGDPDTSPFRQRMGYVIGAITGTMAAFDAWVVQNAPTWTGNATQLLTRVTTITGILQDAIELFDFMDNTTLPSTAEIQQFVTAVLQLFSSFAGELGNLVGEGGMGAHVNAVVNLVSGFVATTMPPLITSWHEAGAALVGGFVDGMAGKIGPESVVGSVAYTIAEIRGELGEFTGWWVPNRGEGYWYTAGDSLVDAFIEGMESNLGNPEGAVYNAAFAIGQAANAGLEAGAASGGNYRPEGLAGPAAGLGKAAAGTFGWSSPSTSTSRDINLTIRFENAPANLDRRTLDELKRTLVYEIQRGA